MLEGIERETIASPASAADDANVHAAAACRIAPACRTSSTYPSAHKTGDSGNIANDVGIIYSRSGPIVIAVLVNGITGFLRRGRGSHRPDSPQLVVDHFDVRRRARMRCSPRASEARDSAARITNRLRRR